MPAVTLLPIAPAPLAQAAPLAERVRRLDGDMAEYRAREAQKAFWVTGFGLLVPTLADAHARLVAAGHTTPEAALALGTPVGPRRAYAPALGDPYTLAVVLADGAVAEGLVVALERTGRPDPTLDRIMADMEPGYVADPTPGAVTRGALYAWCGLAADGPRRYDGPDTLAHTLAAARTDAWLAHRIATAYAPTRYHTGDDAPIEAAHGEIGRDFDRLVTWTEEVRALLAALGLAEAHAARVAALAARPHREPVSTDPLGLAVEAFGRDLAYAEAGLPGAAARAAVGALFATTVETRLEQRALPEAEHVHARCLALGFTGAAQHFDFNDLDSRAFALTSPALAGWTVLALEDQNRAYALAWRPDAVDASVRRLRLHHWAPAQHPAHPAEALTAALLDAPVPAASELGRFTVRAARDGRLVVRAEAPIADHADAIRAWNGVLFETGSAACCLDEDHPAPDPASPTPEPA